MTTRPDPEMARPWDTRLLAEADKRHLWHPFTPMAAWMDAAHEPLVLVRGEGVWLWDSRGRRYLDGNSSIWTNIHGHNHPRLVEALHRQIDTVAHTSFLGFTNPWAIRLAERLCKFFPPGTLTRVFYTDDGSTAIECAVKMAIQYRQQTGEPARTRFIAFDQAYHGDTLGASSLGGVDAFAGRFHGFGFRPHRVASIDELVALPDELVRSVTAVVIEPLIQGVNRMSLWPPGMLRALRAWCDRHDVFLILDEVMTGFGRTGRMFACQHEDVVPDFLCLAKGLTGGTLPLAATLTTERVFNGFLNDGAKDRTFHYGHSYCGNPLGCAVALASLDVFEDEAVVASLTQKAAALAAELEWLRAAEPRHVRTTRQLGLIAAIDLVRDAPTGEAWPAAARMGAAACVAAREAGVLTRPVFDTIVLMPPLCINPDELRLLVRGAGVGIRAACHAACEQPANGWQ